MLGRVESGRLKQLVDILRHRKQRRSGVEAIALYLKLGEFAARISIGFVHVHAVSFTGHAYRRGQACYSCSNDGYFQDDVLLW